MNEENADKIRLIDPSVFYENKLISSSKLSKYIRKMGEHAKMKMESGTFVKIMGLPK